MEQDLTDDNENENGSRHILITVGNVHRKVSKLIQLFLALNHHYYLINCLH